MRKWPLIAQASAPLRPTAAIDSKKCTGSGAECAGVLLCWYYAGWEIVAFEQGQSFLMQPAR